MFLLTNENWIFTMRNNHNIHIQSTYAWKISIQPTNICLFLELLDIWGYLTEYHACPLKVAWTAKSWFVVENGMQLFNSCSFRADMKCIFHIVSFGWSLCHYSLLQSCFGVTYFTLICYNIYLWSLYHILLSHCVYDKKIITVCITKCFLQSVIFHYFYKHSQKPLSVIV